MIIASLLINFYTLSQLCMYRKQHNIDGVQHHMQFQASLGGLGPYTLREEKTA